MWTCYEPEINMAYIHSLPIPILGRPRSASWRRGTRHDNAASASHRGGFRGTRALEFDGEGQMLALGVLGASTDLPARRPTGRPSRRVLEFRLVGRAGWSHRAGERLEHGRRRKASAGEERGPAR